MKNSVKIINKKAKYEYILNDSYISGIVLTGSEIKSIRNSKVSIRESFCKFTNDELFIINMNIEKYGFSNDETYNAKKPRKLLLNKKELSKLKKSIQQKGSSIIPYKIFINEKGLAKLEIFTATGKKLYDKRSSIKEKENKRSLDRVNKRKIKFYFSALEQIENHQNFQYQTLMQIFLNKGPFSVYFHLQVLPFYLQFLIVKVTSQEFLTLQQ